MSQSRIKIAPTKSNLLQLRKQVKFLENGHDLLERKRDLLTRLVYERIRDYRNLKDQALTEVQTAWRWMALAQMRMGSRQLGQASLGTGKAVDIDIIPKRALGVRYPAVQATTLPLEPVGLLGTDATFDEARRTLAEATVALARLGEAKTALSRLIAEQRKAQKRVNALRYNIIPKYKNTMHYIEQALEEDERNTLFQIKVLREQKQQSTG